MKIDMQYKHAISENNALRHNRLLSIDSDRFSSDQVLNVLLNDEAETISSISGNKRRNWGRHSIDSISEDGESTLPHLKIKMD